MRQHLLFRLRLKKKNKNKEQMKNWSAINILLYLSSKHVRFIYEYMSFWKCETFIIQMVMFLRTGCNRNAEKNSEALATENGQQSIVSNSLQSKPIHSLKKPLKVKNRDCYLVIFTKSLIMSKRVHNNLFVLRSVF